MTGEPAETRLDDNGRLAFTASKMLLRKTVFHRNLINIVKYHHGVSIGGTRVGLLTPVYYLVM